MESLYFGTAAMQSAGSLRLSAAGSTLGWGREENSLGELLT